MLAKHYESDQGDTEDEEVKRNCILGQCGMRDSDFSDSGSEEEECEDDEEGDGGEEVREEAVIHINEEKKKCQGDFRTKEDQMLDLVKFVSTGSQIVEFKGTVLYRPKAIMPTSALQVEEPNEKDETLNEPKLKSTPKISSMLPSKDDSDSEESDDGKSIDSDGSDADTESVESDVEMKSPSIDFPFDGREELSTLEVVAAASNTKDDTEGGDIESVSDDQEDAQDEMNGNYALVGASGASVDDKWEALKQKRVLSSNTLSALNEEAGRYEDSQKRVRSVEQSFKDISSIPEITLGVDALDQIIQPLPRQYLIRDDSPLISAPSDEDEDKVLSEELEEKFRNSSIDCNTANSPIPLLTPPQSPRTVDGSLEGQAMTTIEWPSNLVMDSAIINANSSMSGSSEDSNDIKLMKDLPDVLLPSESSRGTSTTRLRAISIATTS